MKAKALRITLKLGGEISVTAIRWLIGRHPLAVRFWINAYNFWGILAEFSCERFELYALPAAWKMYEMHNWGWFKETNS